MRSEKHAGAKIRIKSIDIIDYLSIHELRDLVLDVSRKVERSPELNSLISYTSTFLKLFDGKKLPPEVAKELRERLEQEFNMDKKYAAIVASHLPVSEEELSEILPTYVSSNLTPDDFKKIVTRIREIIKENF